MAVDPRDQIWEAAYDTYYSAYFEEILADALINRWQWVDEVTKVLVALTASGSAISGWALWADQNLKLIWTILAGIAAILAIIHTSLTVPGRIKDQSDIRRWFSGLRIDLETFRYRMQVDPQFPIEQFTSELVELRRRFGEGNERLKNDILITKHLRTQCQMELNERLGDKIIEQQANSGSTS